MPFSATLLRACWGATALVVVVTALRGESPSTPLHHRMTPPEGAGQDATILTSLLSFFAIVAMVVAAGAAVSNSPSGADNAVHVLRCRGTSALDGRACVGGGVATGEPCSLCPLHRRTPPSRVLSDVSTGW